VDPRRAEEVVRALREGKLERIPKSVRAFLEAEGAIKGGEFSPVKAAVALVKMGVDPSRAAALLTWRGFEDFVAEALREAGYRVLRGVWFRARGRRWELDVLGITRPLGVAIDCKMWSRRRGVVSALGAAARRHRDRVAALAEAIDDLIGEMPRPRRIVGMIVSWVGGPRLVDGVLIAPLFLLPRLLGDLDSMLPDLFLLELPPGAPRDEVNRREEEHPDEEESELPANSERVVNCAADDV